MQARPIAFIALQLIVLIGLSACQNLPLKRSVAATPENAEGLARDGQYADASAMFTRLASRSSDPAARDHYLLRSAEVLIDNGQYTPDGRARLAAVPEQLSAPDLQNRLYTLQAKEALISGDAESALLLLPDTASLHSTRHRARVFLIQAQAYTRLDKPAEELVARINLERALTNPKDVRDNHKRIWALLSEQPLETLRHMTTRVHHDAYQGWLELALILRGNTVRADSLKSQVSNWKQRFAEHPATASFADELLAVSLAELPEQTLASHIAVLLPLRGKTASAASAIRDGLITAYLESNELADAPKMRFYDTTARDFAEIYQRAIDDGASFVIGPLNKQSVTLLAAQRSLPVPTLALNYTTQPGPYPENLYQFGLLPEDEAVSAAQRAEQLNYRSALILSSDDVLGQRLSQAFKEALESSNGRVLDTIVLSKDEYDYSQQLRSTLHINQSAQRHRTLQKIAADSIKFEPSIRQDVDLIYLTVDAEQARLVRPQLLFFRAREIPLIASSRVHDRLANTRKDRDLNGIVFSDSIWALPLTTAGNADLDAIVRNWPERDSAIRLYAMGTDAYRVVPFLTNMKDDEHYRFAGHTGDLSLDSNNRLHRHLHWAIFEKGKATLYDGAAKPMQEN